MYVVQLPCSEGDDGEKDYREQSDLNSLGQSTTFFTLFNLMATDAIQIRQCRVPRSFERALVDRVVPDVEPTVLGCQGHSHTFQQRIGECFLILLLGRGFVVRKAGDKERNDVFRALSLRKSANLVIDVRTLSGRRGTEDN